MSVTFIEASAGTGKTYTLVKRVIDLVRGGLPAESILLMTFTEKATAELKTRVREGLHAEGKTSQDPRIAQALEDWSSLTITTIHGFCRTLLTQYPLESGVSFEPEVVDEKERWRRLLRDELRPRLTSLGTLPRWAGLEDEQDLLELASKALRSRVLEIPLVHPDAADSSRFDALRAELEQGNGRLWQAARDLAALQLPKESAKAFANALPLLHAKNHLKPYATARALGEARHWDELAALLNKQSMEWLEKWQEGGTMWNKAASPPFTGTLEAVRTACIEFVAAVRAIEGTLPGVDLGSFLKRSARWRLIELAARPALEHRSDGELTYHDMIARTKRLALDGTLSQTRWKAVLVDEFQDTDRDQWDILSALFLNDGCELVLVGDPKQSIYRFRGADLEVYRAARRQVEHQASFVVLEENFRSTQPMIEALNAWFDPAHTAWPQPGDFHPAKKGAKAIDAVYGKGGELQPIAAFSAESETAWHRHLASTALELLDCSIGSPPRQLTPADLLILVRRNDEAWRLFRLLTSKGIPATVGGGGLLGTREAREVAIFLKALEAPASLAVRALGWTRLLAGATAEVLAPALQAAQSDKHRGAYLRAFRRVAAAVDGLPDGGGLENLLSRPGGPRLVTNAEHVLELVQERHHRGEIPPGQAALSLERWIESHTEEDEIDLRREGDTPMVRIMTIHAAKGLEAPVVLHGWPKESRPRTPDWYKAAGTDALLTEEGRAAEAESETAETQRLSYVAMTRARSHQVVCQTDAAPVRQWTSEEWNAVPRWKAPQLRSEVPALGHAIDGLETRHPWVESHSGLWKRAQGDSDAGTSWDRPLPRDAETEPEETLTEPSLADDLPAGPAFGDLVHDILEAADWRGWAADATPALRADTLATVEDQAGRHRNSLPLPGLGRSLDRWLGRVLSHPLELGGAPPVVFTQLPPEATRRELEFHLPLAHGRKQNFVWGGRELTVHPGYLTGRIDLLFVWHGRLYLADWKSNRLSGQPLEDLMAESGYDLQAQWYWEALTRLCRLQSEPLVPGGVLYVFLRGAGDRPRGVFLSPEVLDANRTLTPFFEAARG